MSQQFRVGVRFSIKNVSHRLVLHLDRVLTDVEPNHDARERPADECPMPAPSRSA